MAVSDNPTGGFRQSRSRFYAVLRNCSFFILQRGVRGAAPTGRRPPRSAQSAEGVRGAWEGRPRAPGRTRRPTAGFPCPLEAGNQGGGAEGAERPETPRPPLEMGASQNSYKTKEKIAARAPRAARGRDGCAARRAPIKAAKIRRYGTLGEKAASGAALHRAASQNGLAALRNAIFFCL